MLHILCDLISVIGAFEKLIALASCFVELQHHKCTHSHREDKVIERPLKP